MTWARVLNRSSSGKVGPVWISGVRSGYFTSPIQSEIKFKKSAKNIQMPLSLKIVLCFGVIFIILFLEAWSFLSLFYREHKTLEMQSSGPASRPGPKYRPGRASCGTRTSARAQGEAITMHFALTAKLRAALEDADRARFGDFRFRAVPIWARACLLDIFFLHLYNTHCNALTELRPLALHV